MKKNINIALVGNPNSGKSSLFNCLTGLNQKVGNFPGVTVDKKTGTVSLAPNIEANIIDLPGSYSLYPRREDEWVSYRVMMGQDEALKADLVVVVADASNLKRNLLYCSQLIDLKVPLVIALSMMDLARSKGIKIDVDALERELGVPVVVINPRKNKGIAELKKIILLTSQQQYKAPLLDFIDNKSAAPEAINELKQHFPDISDYAAIHYFINHENFSLSSAMQETVEQIEVKNNFNPTKTQAEEILSRFNRIKQIMQLSVDEPGPLQKKLFTEKLDNVLLHRKWGYLIMLGVLFLLFQSIFYISNNIYLFFEEKKSKNKKEEENDC